MQFVLEELAADMLHVSIRLFEINRWCHARYSILEARRFRNADDMLNRALDGLDIHSDCLTFGTYTQTHSPTISANSCILAPHINDLQNVNIADTESFCRA